jgi:hypothetical protein
MDVGIRGDVLTIVQDDKRVPNDRAVERDCYRREQNAENGIQTLAGKERASCRKCSSVRTRAGLGTCFRERVGWTHPLPRLYTAAETPSAAGFLSHASLVETIVVCGVMRPGASRLVMTIRDSRPLGHNN